MSDEETMQEMWREWESTPRSAGFRDRTKFKMVRANQAALDFAPDEAAKRAAAKNLVDG